MMTDDHCSGHVSTIVIKAWDNKVSNKLTIAGHFLFSIVSSVNPRSSKKEACKTTEELLSLLYQSSSLLQVEQ